MISGQVNDIRTFTTIPHKTIKNSVLQIIKLLPSQRQAITHDNYIFGLLWNDIGTFTTGQMHRYHSTQDHQR